MGVMRRAEMGHDLGHTDTHTHIHTNKAPRAGMQLVGHTSITLPIHRSSSSAFICYIQQIEYSPKMGFRERKKERGYNF